METRLHAKFGPLQLVAAPLRRWGALAALPDTSPGNRPMWAKWANRIFTLAPLSYA